MLFSNVLAADELSISLTKVKFWLTPWVRDEDHLPLTHVAELAHKRGLARDTITVECSGGLNPLMIPGLPKDRARALSTACAGASARRRRRDLLRPRSAGKVSVMLPARACR
jgi:hypothetical protein